MVVCWGSPGAQLTGPVLEDPTLAPETAPQVLGHSQGPCRGQAGKVWAQACRLCPGHCWEAQKRDSLESDRNLAQNCPCGRCQCFATQQGIMCLVVTPLFSGDPPTLCSPASGVADCPPAWRGGRAIGALRFPAMVVGSGQSR